MKIFKGIASVKGEFKNCVVAIGVFDGLHLGHQLLIRNAVRRAKALGGKAIVMTFDPHPVHVLRPENHLPLLVSLPFRLKLIAALGVDAVVVVRFTKTFSRLSPQQFISKYLVRPFLPREIIVGDDFRFGQNRSGTISVFEHAGQKYAFEVVSVKTTKAGHKKFSSTVARDAIAVGNLKKASLILGRPVSLLGPVVRGDQRGKTLGYPTANIVPTGEILPPQGVYCVRIVLGRQSFLGIANVGVRPSFHKEDRLNVEVHIFDFKKNIYGKEICVAFLHKIRNEMYFPSSKDLVAQIQKDEAFARKWFARQKI